MIPECETPIGGRGARLGSIGDIESLLLFTDDRLVVKHLTEWTLSSNATRRFYIPISTVLDEQLWV